MVLSIAWENLDIVTTDFGQHRGVPQTPSMRCWSPAKFNAGLIHSADQTLDINSMFRCQEKLSISHQHTHSLPVKATGNQRFIFRDRDYRPLLFTGRWAFSCLTRHCFTVCYVYGQTPKHNLLVQVWYVKTKIAYLTRLHPAVCLLIPSIS